MVYVSDKNTHEVSFNVYKSYTSRYTERPLMIVPGCPYGGIKKLVYRIILWIT